MGSRRGYSAVVSTESIADDQPRPTARLPIGGGGGSGVAARVEDQSLQRAGLGTTFLSLINVTLGAGVLSYPFAFARGGWLAMSAFTVLVGAIALLSGLVLARAAIVCGASHQGDVALHMVGRAGGVLANITMTLFTFGACTGYLLVVGDYFPEVVEAFVGLPTHPLLSARGAGGGYHLEYDRNQSGPGGDCYAAVNASHPRCTDGYVGFTDGVAEGVCCIGCAPSWACDRNGERYLS
jgi:hypothetical protein